MPTTKRSYDKTFSSTEGICHSGVHVLEVSSDSSVKSSWFSGR